MSVESEIRPLSERHDELRKVHEKTIKALSEKEQEAAKYKTALKQIIDLKGSVASRLDKAIEISRNALGITDRQRAEELERQVEILRKALEEAEKRTYRPEPKNPWPTSRRCPFCERPLKLGERCHCQDYIWPSNPDYPFPSPIRPYYEPKIWCINPEFPINK